MKEEQVLVDVKAMKHYHKRIKEQLDSGGGGGGTIQLKPLPPDEFYKIWNR